MIKQITGIILFTAVFAGGAYLVLTGGSQPEPTIMAYANNAKDRPIAKVERSFIDIGKMKVTETKEVDFTIKNSGSKPLQITRVTTSCGCTTAQIIYRDNKSKAFSMHAQSNYVMEVAPGTSALVRVAYLPFTMPVYGEVGREVYISTNDPVNPKIVLQIKAYVEK